VRAAIINDGSGTPYRLSLTSTKTGAANAISITNNLNTGTGAAIDPLNTTVQAASDATVKLGSGAGAITVNSTTNQLNGLIPGVSLNALKADTTKPIVVTVTNDTEAVSTALKDFVTSFNATIDFINSQSKFDPKTQQGGVLLGNRDTATLANELTAALSASIPGLSTNANRLSSVGLSFGSDNKLTLDQSKLDQALSGQNGANLADLKKLFAISGTSDNPGVSFVLGTGKTQPSSGSPYQVQVTAPATRAAAVATNALGGSVTLSPPNNSLMLKLNGLTAVGITLDPGTYTPESLTTLLQQRINSNTALNGNLVSVGLTPDNKLQITSQQYGAASTVAFDGGGALATLGFTGTETGTGTDVAGSFIVNGQTEAATGTGQSLTGNAGNSRTDGLQVRATTTTPTTANVNVTQGVASRLSAVLTKYLDATSGKLKTIDDGFQQQFDALGKTITRQNTFLDSKKSELARRFAAMESAVNNLKGLQGQLTSLVPTTSNR
jgi:flagellar hook-associated protein 2